MADRLVRTDLKRGKAVFLRDIVNEDGITTQQEVEIDIPVPETREITVRKYIIDEEGHRREVLEKVRIPVFDKGKK